MKWNITFRNKHSGQVRLKESIPGEIVTAQGEFGIAEQNRQSIRRLLSNAD